MQEFVKSNQDRLKAKASILIANCIDEKEVDILGDLHSVFECVVNLLEIALKSDDRRAFGFA